MATHSGTLLSKCAQFREQGEFIDVHLKVGEEVFTAHRIVPEALFLRQCTSESMYINVQSKMASMYNDVCENEEFLSHVDANQYSSLLSRDDLSAPSETFVFKSVMQWIKHKKEERMAVASKVIGAVRLGLVDIREIIEELNTEEMKQIPEIFSLVYETLVHNYSPSNRSKFALEKAKPRFMSQVTTIFCVPQFS